MKNSESNLQAMAPAFAKAIEFIWQEASLLDRKDYHAWSALWREDGLYVIPTNRETTDFEASLNYAYDDARMRKLRIDRLTSGMSMSVDAAAVTVRTVSRFTQVSADSDSVTVESSQVLIGYKRGIHKIYAADLSHTICFENGGPRLQQKVVRLVNAADSLNALGFLL